MKFSLETVPRARDLLRQDVRRGGLRGPHPRHARGAAPDRGQVRPRPRGRRRHPGLGGSQVRVLPPEGQVRVHQRLPAAGRRLQDREAAEAVGEGDEEA